MNETYNFTLLQVTIIRVSWCKNLVVVLKNKFHYYFCHGVWYHSKVNKTLLIILIKSSNFIQSCSLGIQAMETSLTFILNDTISYTSSFLLPVVRVSADHQIVTECLLSKSSIPFRSWGRLYIYSSTNGAILICLGSGVVWSK